MLAGHDALDTNHLLQRDLRRSRGSPRAFQGLGGSCVVHRWLGTGCLESRPRACDEIQYSAHPRGDVTRLLIDLDQDGEKRWSKISSKLPEATRDKLVTRLEDKFRHAIEVRLGEDFKRHDAVTHLLIHTAPIADGKITFEHIGSPNAQEIADKAAKMMPQHEVDSSSVPLMDKSPFVRWLLDSFDSGKYGIIRITVSQSFFMRSVPMRWETIKKSLINALVQASK